MTQNSPLLKRIAVLLIMVAVGAVAYWRGKLSAQSADSASARLNLGESRPPSADPHVVTQNDERFRRPVPVPTPLVEESAPPPDPVAVKTPVLTGIPFKAKDCLANPSFNPQGKSLDEVQMRQLQSIIDKWRDADRNLFDECETQRFALNDIKLGNGDWIPLKTGEKVHSAPGSISSSIQVDRDGMKQIVIYPGQFAPLDDAIARRAENLQGARTEIIRSIAAN